MMKHRYFSYISDGLKRQLTTEQFATHEYWGKDFEEGNCTVGIFTNGSGKFTAVWSYGDWRGYGLELNERVIFVHTQTGRRMERRLVGFFDRNTGHAVFAGKKMTQWTLK